MYGKCASRLIASDRYSTFMCFNDFFHEGQAQAAALDLIVDSLLPPKEGLEDLRQVFLGNSATAIPNGNGYFRTSRRRTLFGFYIHSGVLPGVLDGIGDEVLNNLTQSVQITNREKLICREPGMYVGAPFLDIKPAVGQRCIDNFPYGYGPHFIDLFSRLHLAKGKNPFDHFGEAELLDTDEGRVTLHGVLATNGAVF